MGSFQVSKCCTSVVGVATLVALSCLSACVTASGTPVTCKDTLDFAATSLKQPQSEVQLKCPQGSVIFPALESQQFCQNAGCTNQVQLSSVSVTSKEASAGDHSETRKKTDEFILTLSANPAKSHTLYFQCKASTRQNGGNNVTEQENATQVKCIIQVAVHGSTPAASKEKEEECGDRDVSVTLDGNRSEVTFRCGANTSLLPANFEKTFKGHTCSGDEVDLANLPLSASLVEGKSTTSVVAATSSLPAGDVPAYTFHVTESPTTEKQLCYKCTSGTADPARGQQPSKECKVLITVSPPAPKPDGPADDPNSNEQGGDVHSDEQEETPNGQNQNPENTETSSNSSRMCSSRERILAVTLLFSSYLFMG